MADDAVNITTLAEINMMDNCSCSNIKVGYKPARLDIYPGAPAPYHQGASAHFDTLAPITSTKN